MASRRRIGRAASVALLLSVILGVISATRTAYAAPAPPPPPQQQKQQQAPQESKQQLLAAITSDVDFLAQSVWSFWARHGLDTEYGGFHGTLDRQGRPAEPTFKGLIQQARHMWAFSEFHKRGVERLPCPPGQQQPPPCPAAASLPTSRQLADAAFAFVADRMRDPKGSGLFVWAVSRDGKSVVSPNLGLYANCMAVLALSNYAQASGSSRAKELALTAFHALDARWHDGGGGGGAGGYLQLASNSNWYADDPGARARPDAAQPARDLNELIHAAEALDALHAATGDAAALARLLELLDVLCARLGAARGGAWVQAYVPAAGGKQWAPAQGSLVGYGHNLEAAWLLGRVVERLRASGALQAAPAAACSSRLQQVGRAAVADGYDAAHGGFFNLGDPSSGAATDTAKVWWVQAEAAQALWSLHAGGGGQGGDQGAGYLDKLARTTSFMRRYSNDAAFGEMFWQVAADGNSDIQYSPGRDIKGNKWKASYHTGRMATNLAAWLRAA